MLRGFFKGLANIFYPKVCLACKNVLADSTAEEFICAKCWGGIEKNTPPFCSSCGRRLESRSFAKNICPRCLRNKSHFDRAFSPCVYTGVVKELIHAFKYNGKEYLGRPLSRLMIEFIREYSLPIKDLEFIVPIPLHKARLREREFNQAKILSEHLGKEFDKPVLDKLLVRNRHTRTQTELEENERLLNVKGSFTLNGRADLRGKNILLVDDVLTTGATSSEAAYALKQAGANIVFVLTLAN
jgi:ComF family protein